MLSARTILSLLTPTAMRRLAYTLLGWALVPLAEILLIVWLSGVIGVYLVLAAAATLSLTGAWLALARLRGDVRSLSATVEAGTMPTRELGRIAGALASLFLILSPGFCTDLVGFVILLTRARGAVGGAIVRWAGIDAKEIFEYLRLSETTRGP